MKNFLLFKYFSFYIALCIMLLILPDPSLATDAEQGPGTVEKYEKFIPKGPEISEKSITGYKPGLLSLDKSDPVYLDNPVPLSDRKALGAKRAMEYIRRREEARSLTEDDNF